MTGIGVKLSVGGADIEVSGIHLEAAPVQIQSACVEIQAPGIQIHATGSELHVAIEAAHIPTHIDIPMAAEKVPEHRHGQKAATQDQGKDIKSYHHASLPRVGRIPQPRLGNPSPPPRDYGRHSGELHCKIAS
jgi:hypothetical protein